MPTQVSHITRQAACIYLEVDQDTPLRELLQEAQELATSENKMVMFYASGNVFQVTNQSNIERMIIGHHDRFNTSVLIV